MARTAQVILGIVFGTILWIVIGGTLLSHLGISGMIEAILGGEPINIPKIFIKEVSHF